VEKILTAGFEKQVMPLPMINVWEKFALIVEE